MTIKKSRFKNIFWFGIIISLISLPVLASISATDNSSLPLQNTAVIAPRQVVDTTNSLQKAQQLFKKNKYKEALKTSLDLLKKATTSKDSLLIEKTSFLIARIFKNTHNYDKSLEYFIKSSQFANESTDSVHYVAIQLNIGIMYSRIKKPDTASYYYKKVIEIKSNKKEIELFKAKAYANISAAQVEQGNILQAEINALEAEHIQSKFNDSFAHAHVLNNLATIYIEQKRYRDAKREFFKALSLIRKDKTQRGLEFKEIILDNLSWALYQLKDYRTYIYQEQSFRIRDSLRDAEIGGYLAEIEGKFNKNTIKKREELKTAEERTKRLKAQGFVNILLIVSLSLLMGAWLIYRYLKLRQKNLQLEFSQNQLIQQNKLEQLENETREKILNATLDGKESERKMIAETLHHSVSSLLSSASLHLQASKRLLKEKPPKEIEKARIIIDEAAVKIRNLSHSLVSSVLLKFGLGYAIQDLCEKYSNAALNFHCDCNGINRYDPDFELKINSIIDELLNNIIKHSNASNAEIKLNQKNQLLEITILDDGKGFDLSEEVLTSGLGLRQIEARIRKMQGIFKINSSPNEGVSIFISVPIKFIKKKEITKVL